jgi:hypothetical protein
LFDNSHGRLSQKSSLMMSRCSTVTRALALRFFSFSSCVLDCFTGSARLSAAVVTSSWVPGSTSSYYMYHYFSDYALEKWQKRSANKATYVSKHDTSFLEDFWLVIVVDVESRKQDLVLVCRQCTLAVVSLTGGECLTTRTGLRQETSRLPELPSLRVGSGTRMWCCRGCLCGLVRTNVRNMNV